MTITSSGLYENAKQLHSTHYDERPENDISLLVIHCISLPQGQFGTPYIDDLFCGQLDCNAHESFASLEGVRVSAHCLIDRAGAVRQYVPFSKRAWHAGVSSFAGKARCNDFSIGIELEGTDKGQYTDAQYQSLAQLTQALMIAYPKITQNTIVGHSDIAPGRKTDPGEGFDWRRFFHLTFKDNCDRLKEV
ncbi:1,6-anhydro-N-acetylmuramyl-L-alanine amidase AmpD [Pseudoalteromonas sp. SSDWG2]|uniref:1,6-anhydro-N-acetylmuramyl-L-alanine amidase AmpD n=1 Tax=Pseudoalteromonas sp. SSDWG2 TaxID=3139391 RepID=UPI003BAC74EA